MKFLLFSDVHVDRRYCQHLVALSEQADVVVGAGDFGSLRRGIVKTINWLSSIKKPTVLVPGNAESYEELVSACSTWPEAVVLHGSACSIAGWSFYGIGGGIPVTPFGSWSYDFSESQALELLKDCPTGGILVSHSPPFGVLDISSGGQHLGSTAVLQTMQSRSPRLLVCGHIHESCGQQYEVNGTTVVNAGPEGMFVEL
ncbi:MAG: metallophosphoesterase family protein [Cyclobacteriaceae bacterium]|nr:metallophosphoesterase family protein [Cyclobacteriaceae bacterium]